MEYYSAIKKDGIALMDLEIITVSEISLTDKDKYDITYTQKVKKKKKDTNELIYKTETDSQT